MNLTHLARALSFVVRRAINRQATVWPCHRCKANRYAVGHATSWTIGRIVTALCEDCWRDLTPEERWPFYEAELKTWGDACTPKIATAIWQEVVLRGK